MTTPPSSTGKLAAPPQVKDEEEDLDDLDGTSFLYLYILDRI